MQRDLITRKTAQITELVKRYAGKINRRSFSIIFKKLIKMKLPSLHLHSALAP